MTKKQFGPTYGRSVSAERRRPYRVTDAENSGGSWYHGAGTHWDVDEMTSFSADDVLNREIDADFRGVRMY